MRSCSRSQRFRCVERKNLCGGSSSAAARSNRNLLARCATWAASPIRGLVAFRPPAAAMPIRSGIGSSSARHSGSNRWIDSDRQKQSFEAVLLDMYAIVVGGGNTLYMLGIWRCPEIDAVLRKAYERSIVLNGGRAVRALSAGSPAVSATRGLAISPSWRGSACSLSATGPITIYLRRGRFTSSSRRAKNCRQDMRAKSTREFYSWRAPLRRSFDQSPGTELPGGTQPKRSEDRHAAIQCLMRKGALDEAVYRKEPIRRHVSEWTEFLYSMQTPLLAFVFVQRIFVYGRFRSPHPAPHPRYANGLRNWRIRPWRRLSESRRPQLRSLRYSNRAISRQWFRRAPQLSTPCGISCGKTEHGSTRARTSAAIRKRVQRQPFGIRPLPWRPQPV